MNSYDYSQEYADAFTRTLSFGLDVPEQQRQSGSFFQANQDPKLVSVLSSVLGNIPPEDISAQCFAIHYAIRHAVDSAYQTRSVLTLGWVHDPPCDFFRLSEQELASVVKNGISGPTLNLHCWLTLPTHELLDCTLATTKAIADGKPDNIGLVMAKHWSGFTGGLRYHPMVVGHHFLEEAGIVLGL
jgi:hypothetical protein